MPYLKEHNLLFIHIPKTGGTSIEKQFGIYHKWNMDILLNNKHQTINGISTTPQHWTPNLIKDKLGEDIYNNCIKFTVIRNPYTRILSEYFYQNKNGNINKFNQWLPKYLKNCDHDHKLPQHLYLVDQIDFIAKTETLNKDFEEFVQKFNIKINPKLGLVNKTPHDKSKLISKILPKNIEIINQVYNKDFEVLGYEMINP